jgi:CDP-4-dehydro-6-deoxyglucose reductase
MPRLLTLSRAARLVGVRRGALQSKIRSGELAAFEGMIAMDDLLRAYPQARLEDNAGLERFEAIKDAAFARRMRERLMPSTEALVARLAEMSRERAQVQAQLEHYRGIVEQLQARLRTTGDAAGLLAWLSQRLEPAAGQSAQPLLAQENFLRIMTAHVQVKPSGREFFVDGNDSLLEAALRSGLSLDYGCSIGSCGKCKARILSGQAHRTRHSDYALTAAE